MSQIPTRRSAPGFSLAATAAGLTAPSIAVRSTPIAALQRRLTALTAVHNQIDVAILEMPDGADCAALHEWSDKVLEDCMALHDEIVELPAEDLHDAAIQATIGYYRLDCVTGRDEGDNSYISDLRTLLVSILLATVKAADLDIDRLGGGEMARICAVHGPKGSAAA